MLFAERFVAVQIACLLFTFVILTLLLEGTIGEGTDRMADCQAVPRHNWPQKGGDAARRRKWRTSG